MPEYRRVRERHSLLEICRTPELAAEVTLQPVRAFPVDAAILFSDLLVPLEPMGFRFGFAKGEGPVIEEPIRQASDVERLRPLDPESQLSFTMQAIRILRGQLQVPLLGFAGAAWGAAWLCEHAGRRERR